MWKKLQKEEEFQVGYKFLLYTKNVGGIKKLYPKFIAPLTIVKKGRAYRFDLPGDLRGPDHTFNISVIKQDVPGNYNRGSYKTTAAALKTFGSLHHLLNPEIKSIREGARDKTRGFATDLPRGRP